MKKKLSIISILIFLFATVLWAADATYGPKVYKTDGGDREVVASGGTLDVETSGIVKFGGTSYTSGTDTLVTTTSTATLTNKTITDPGISFAVSSKVFTAGEDWELSTAEKKSVLLIVSSGSGTPSIVADASSSGKIYILRNAANINVILKASGQTGITVASGKTAILMNSGTDFVRVTGDATH